MAVAARARSTTTQPRAATVAALGFAIVVVLAADIALVTTGATPSASMARSPAASFQDAFERRQAGSFGLDNVEVLSGEDGFERVLRVQYPKGSASPTVTREEGAPVGGAQEYLALGDGRVVDRLNLRYYVRFPSGFDFVKGGKLPGLFGGTVTGGRRTPDGSDGFSARYMWRVDGVGEVYAYLATSDGEGTSLGRGQWSFTPGRWHLLEQEVVLNRPGCDDGHVRVWLDEELVLQEEGLRYRSVDTLGIEGVFFSTFFGGGDPSWATPHDTYLDLAGLAVSDEYLGRAVR